MTWIVVGWVMWCILVPVCGLVWVQGRIVGEPPPPDPLDVALRRVAQRMVVVTHQFQSFGVTAHAAAVYRFYDQLQKSIERERDEVGRG